MGINKPSKHLNTAFISAVTSMVILPPITLRE